MESIRSCSAWPRAAPVPSRTGTKDEPDGQVSWLVDHRGATTPSHAFDTVAGASCLVPVRRVRASAAPLPTYSGGTAWDSHPLPFTIREHQPTGPSVARESITTPEGVPEIRGGCPAWLLRRTIVDRGARLTVRLVSRIGWTAPLRLQAWGLQCQLRTLERCR